VNTSTPPPAFLTARWAKLAMLNYEVDPQILADRVPAGTVLDTWEGRCFASMVGFLFLDTRVLGIPIPFHRDFEEVNLRFYVRRELPGELRRGVVFVKEIVPKPAIAWTARLAYNENYVALPMAHQLETTEAAQKVAYSWEWQGQTSRLEIQTKGEPSLVEAGSLEHFISEHYYGYARQRDGSTVEYQVEHPPWQVWQGEGGGLECDAGAFYGPEFAAPLGQPPGSMFLAEGSPVTVRRGKRIVFAS
jgi:uncharacterized protein